MEAAIIASLTAFGMQPEVAVPAVFLYRLLTFWGPVLPGWGCLVVLRRAGDL